jgi:hypothetical protein
MSGASISSGTIPNAALVTTPVTSVTASGPIASSGGTTPAISCPTCVTTAGGQSIAGTTTIASLVLGTPLAIAQGGTGSTTQNFVDLTTPQTIAGNKTFSNNIIGSANVVVTGYGSFGSYLQFGANNSSWATSSGGHCGAANSNGGLLYNGSTTYYAVHDSSGNFFACGSIYGANLYPTNPLGVTYGGTGGSIGSGAALTAATAAINTTETIIATDSLGTASLAVGTTFDFKAYGTCTASAANNSTFTVRFGTTGTISDPSIATWTVTSATTGTAIPFQIDMPITVRTIGSGTSATVYASAALDNNGTTGISATTPYVNAVAVGGFPSNISAGILSVSYKSAAVTTTTTFQTAIIAMLHP